MKDLRNRETRWLWLLLTTPLLLGSSSARPAEPVLESHIVSVAMFKNGLALVERTATPPAAGVYRLSAGSGDRQEAPRPVHGTLWITGAKDVSVRVAARGVSWPRGSPELDLQRYLGGLNVALRLRGVDRPVQGLVRPPHLLGSLHDDSGTDPPSDREFLVLDADSGELLVRTTSIVDVRASGDAAPIQYRRRPVLLLEVGGEAAGKEITIRYLSPGISWAPSYDLDLSSDERLVVRQNAAIRNELADLHGTELVLVSGFPNIPFREVESPLAPGASWANFFAQMRRRSDSHRYPAPNAATQQAVLHNYVSPSIDLSATPAGEDTDLHHESIGPRTLLEHEAIQLEVATAEAPFERIVEWIVPDDRDANGRPRSRHSSRDELRESQGEPWDALRFRNPLPMPMTTAPATITRGGRFLGQTLSSWVSRGELTTLRVTKALSIRTLASENERPDSRERVMIGRNDYDRALVDGNVSVSNHRAFEVNLLIRRRFSGEVTRAEGNPDTRLLPEGVHSVNRRNELLWDIRLEPGETRELAYEYRVLVDR